MAQYTFFTQFTVGSKITLADLTSSWPEGSLMKTPGQNSVWYITGSTRRLMSDNYANNFQSRFVKQLPGSWQTLPIGLTVTAREDRLFSEQLP